MEHKAGQIQAEAMFLLAVTEITFWDIFTDETPEFCIKFHWKLLCIFTYFMKVL